MTIVDVSITTLQDLKLLPQWVCYRSDKVPFHPSGKPAKANDPSTWSTYSEVLRAWRQSPDIYAGMGFELKKEQNLTVVDLDKCIDDNGQISPFAQRVISLLNSYTEHSPSIRGFHIWVRGSIPKNIPQDPDISLKIEMYDCKHYFTITGSHLDGTPDTFEDRQEALLALHQEIETLREQAKEAKQQTKRQSEHKVTRTTVGGDTPYGLTALDRECQDVAATGEGGRNNRLNKAAYSLGQLVGGNELTRSTVERELYHAAERCGLSHSDIEKTLRSGLESGMKEPRTSPPAESKYYDPSPVTSSNGNRGSVYVAPAPPAPDKPFHLTDLGNAERFALRYKDTVRWCETWKSWMVFNGKCWEQDKTGRADQLAKIVVRAIYAEASKIEDPDERKRIAKHAAASESNRAVRAMLDRAKSELPATPEDFNNQLYLLNCENGTLDLRTGELQPHDPHDMLTRCIKVKYNPLAWSKRWEDFISTILGEDGDLITFMKQALGMSLCGDTSEQCLFICYGMGSNGKTTMLETVRIIMGAYACAANIETFQMRKTETIGNDVAELYGARMVTASETKLGGRLNESFVKKATGKEPLRARRLHENEFEFMPEFTLWLAVNHKPVVLDTSKGMWRRVHFIPFNVTIDGAQVDKHFGDKLLEEAEGVFAWLVQGCMEWAQQGHLTVPQIVKEATAGYRAEMDIVANFLKDECILAPGLKAQTKKLIERFESWCGHNSEKFDAKILKNSLKERGFRSEKGTGGVYYWQNIGLTDNTDTSSEDLWNENKSGGSGGSGPKNRVNSKPEKSPDATLNSRPLPPLPPLSKDDEEMVTGNGCNGRNHQTPYKEKEFEKPGNQTLQPLPVTESDEQETDESCHSLPESLVEPYETLKKRYKRRANILWTIGTEEDYLTNENFFKRLQDRLSSDDSEKRELAIEMMMQLLGRSYERTQDVG